METNFSSIVIVLFLFAACQQPSTRQASVASEEVTKQTIPSKRWAAEPYRNQNWHPEKGQYYFSEQWTWSYENQLVAAEHPHRKGTMSIYVDPPSGTLLLNRQATKYGDEMTDWIIITPAGKYITGFTGVHGEKQKIVQYVKDFPEYAIKLQQQTANFQQYFKKMGTSKQFGENPYNNPTITAEAYQMAFERTNRTADLYLAVVPFSLRPFYWVQKTNPDLRFPINLDFGYLLPANYLVVEETYQEANTSIHYHLESMSSATHFLDITAYEF